MSRDSDLVSSQTVFGHLNANKLSPEAVASGFVPPPQFRLLTAHNNTLLVGPRGSGKTTLMKMLSRRALNTWSRAGNTIAESLGTYTGIFVGSDVLAHAQLEGLSGGEFSETQANVFRQAAYTTSVLLAVLEALDEELRAFDIVLSKREEADLVSSLAEGWRLRPRVASLAALRQSLSLRHVQIGETVTAESLSETDGRDERLRSDPALTVRLFDCLAYGFDAVNPPLRGMPGTWALLLDELELVPAVIRDEILGLLRGTGDKFLFKLALTPLSNASTFVAKAPEAWAHAGHDYDPVDLTFSSKLDHRTFATNLLRNELDRAGVPNLNLDQVLGVSPFSRRFDQSLTDEVEEGQARSVVPPITNDELISELIARDPSFQRYADEHGLTRYGTTPADVQRRLEELSEDDTAAIVRKAKPIMLLRYYVLFDRRNADERDRRTRSLKSKATYAGNPTLLDLADGNPRILLAVANALIGQIADHRAAGFKGPHWYISGSSQSEVVYSVIDRFKAFARTVVDKHGFVLGRLTVMDLLEEVGTYGFDEVYVEDFRAEPVTSFTIDSRIPRRVLHGLLDAAYAGAIVPLDDGRSPSPQVQSKVSAAGRAPSRAIDAGDPMSIVGRKFRLSYLLAASHWLPIRITPAVQLSKMLSRNHLDVLEAELRTQGPDPDNQQVLFQ